MKNKPCQTYCCPQIFYLEEENLYQIDDDYGGSIKLNLAQLRRILKEAEDSEEEP
jgi:hypothetical protein